MWRSGSSSDHLRTNTQVLLEVLCINYSKLLYKNINYIYISSSEFLFFWAGKNTENLSLVFLVFRRYDWLRDSLSSSSLRLRSNRCVSDSRTDGIGWRVTAASESVRSCLRESIHWLFLKDWSMNSALCCCSVANESRSWLTWGEETRWHHQHHLTNPNTQRSSSVMPHLVLQLPHSAPQLFYFCGVSSLRNKPFSFL